MALAAHPSVVYFKASNGSAVSGDEVDGIKDVGISINGDQLDTTDFKDTSGWHTFIQGLKGATINLSGDVEAADAPQNLLRTYVLAGTSGWLTLHRNPGGGSGEKGFKAETKVESYEEKLALDGTVGFSASLKVTGAVAAE